MKDRINQIKLKEGLTDGQFAEKIGISPASLSHILNGRNNPSLEVVNKIRKACSYINIDWLLDGTGDMEKSNYVDNEPQNSPSLFDENPFFVDKPSDDAENRKEIELKRPSYPTKEVVREEIKYIEIPSRKITEIRIFFDNGTYETFRPDK